MNLQQEYEAKQRAWRELHPKTDYEAGRPQQEKVTVREYSEQKRTEIAEYSRTVIFAALASANAARDAIFQELGIV